MIGANAETLYREQLVPAPLAEVFGFFSEAENLQGITPPWLHFQILGVSTPELAAGTTIDYRLRLRGIPLRWRTLIEEWVPNSHFVDTQLKGPYKLWHHTHRFYETPTGTRVVDEVRYILPAGRVGNLLALRWVKRDIDKIFDYRKSQIATRF